MLAERSHRGRCAHLSPRHEVAGLAALGKDDEGGPAGQDVARAELVGRQQHDLRIPGRGRPDGRRKVADAGTLDRDRSREAGDDAVIPVDRELLVVHETQARCRQVGDQGGLAGTRRAEHHERPPVGVDHRAAVQARVHPVGIEVVARQQRQHQVGHRRRR